LVGYCLNVLKKLNKAKNLKLIKKT